MLFNSVERAERYLEPIDVKAGEYIGFNSNAHPLAISMYGREASSSHKWPERVIIRIDDSKPRQESELRKVLVGILEYLYVYPSQDVSLDDLIALALKYCDVHE